MPSRSADAEGLSARIDAYLRRVAAAPNQTLWSPQPRRLGSIMRACARRGLVLVVRVDAWTYRVHLTAAGNERITAD